jgi:hypothetical protein
MNIEIGDEVEYIGYIPKEFRPHSMTYDIIEDNIRKGWLYTISKISNDDWCRLEGDNFWYPVSIFIMTKESFKRKYKLK